MNQKLQQIFNIIQQSDKLDTDQKDALLKGVKDADKELEITAFKLDRTEKVKKTTAILLEETIEELEQKRKAVEAQAHEAKIESSLERVRLQAMAMNKGEDLTDAIKMVFSGLDELGFKTIRCGIGIFDDQSKKVNVWTVSPDEDGGSTVSLSGDEVLEGHPLLEGIFDAWMGQKNYSYKLTGNDLVEYYRVVGNSNLPTSPPKNINEDLVQYYHCVMFPAGGLFAFSEENFSEESKRLMKRFGDVFNLAFTRHLDLKLAEAQVRESQIEAALERVRAKTMAMHKSNELAQTAAHLFSQLNSLGINPYRCNIAIVDNESNSCCQLWSTTKSGNVIPTSSYMPLDECNILNEIYNGWKEEKLFHIIKLEGEKLLSWNNYIKKYTQFKESDNENHNEENSQNEQTILSNFNFKQGFFIIHFNKVLNEDELNLVHRFARVFEQTYTRFLDLERAENQNRLIQAENERKSQELEEARQLQLAMLPKEVPKMPNLEIDVHMTTATEVGGDYYDFQIGSDGTLTAVIGDATGHGMKAGTMVTITKSLFNTLAAGKDIIKTFNRISSVVKDMKFRQLSMCLQMVKIKDNDLSISSAAMPPAYIYRKNDNCVEEILLSGMPLGAMINYQYKIEKRTINKGDVILLLSDGLPELLNEKKQMYGYDRIKKEFKSVGQKSPKEIVKHFESSAIAWLNGYEADDDVTFVVIKVK